MSRIKNTKLEINIVQITILLENNQKKNMGIEKLFKLLLILIYLTLL